MISSKDCEEAHDKFLIEVTPKVVAYQLNGIKDTTMLFSIELVESKFNSGNKAINIFTNKNLYLVVIPLLILVLGCLFVLKEPLRIYLFEEVYGAFKDN